MESGENPELSRSGIQLQIPSKPIVREGGEGGEEARSWESEYLAFRWLVARQADSSGEMGSWSSAKGDRRGKIAGDSPVVLSS